MVSAGSTSISRTVLHGLRLPKGAAHLAELLSFSKLCMIMLRPAMVEVLLLRSSPIHALGIEADAGDGFEAPNSCLSQGTGMNLCHYCWYFTQPVKYVCPSYGDVLVGTAKLQGFQVPWWGPSCDQLNKVANGTCTP